MTLLLFYCMIAFAQVINKREKNKIHNCNEKCLEIYRKIYRNL